MITELSRVIDSVVKDKNLNKDEIIEAVESAVLSAAKKLLGKENELEVHYNEETGEVELFEFKEVVKDIEDTDTQLSLKEANQLDPDSEIGDVLGVKISPDYSRIAIQNAKQTVLQYIKEAEGKVIFSEFVDRKGDLISGIVRRVERRNVVVDLGRTEAILPKEEQVPHEYYKPKERIRAVLLDILETPRGTRLILSRSSTEFVRKLFETEIPEIPEQTIAIKSIARDPGSRTKISVHSNDPDVDPVGACVGMRGVRVQNIIQELKGEKIDIVLWSEDSARYMCNALSPAKVNKVIVDERDKSMEVIVDDDQLSLAIGRKGQNVRLASHLTDWKVDIKTEKEVNEEQMQVVSLFVALPNLGEFTAKLLYAEGYRSLEDIAFAEPEILSRICGIEDHDEIKKIQTAARLALKDKLEKIEADEPIVEDKGEELQDQENSEEGVEGDITA